MKRKRENPPHRSFSKGNPSKVISRSTKIPRGPGNIESSDEYCAHTWTAELVLHAFSFSTKTIHATRVVMSAEKLVGAVSESTRLPLK